MDNVGNFGILPPYCHFYCVLWLFKVVFVTFVLAALVLLRTSFNHGVALCVLESGCSRNVFLFCL